MNNWIYFVLIAQGIWSITSVIDKVVISKGYIKNPAVYIVLNGITNILLIFLLPFVGFEPLKFADFLIALFAGVAFSISVTLYYKAVQYDEISRVVMMYQITPIFILILSFFLIGERLTKNYFIGFLFLLGAGLIISYKKVGNLFRFSKALNYMLISAFFSALALVSGKHIFNVTSFWSAFLWLRLTAISSVGVVIVPSIRNQFIETFKSMKNNIKVLLTSKMIIDFSAFIFSAYAIFNGRVSLVSALSTSVAPVFVFIVALIASVYLPKLVKEGIDRKAILTKVFALVLIAIGIVFVSM